MLTSFNTESPPISSNHIIGVYLAESGEKLYDEMPVPDDRKNPQINRWGRAYVMQNPVWSPDGTRYAYTINGALCVNNDGTGKPLLLSQIPDNEAVTDRLMAWSPDRHQARLPEKRKQSGHHLLEHRQGRQGAQGHGRLISPVLRRFGPAGRRLGRRAVPVHPGHRQDRVAGKG